MVDPSTYDPANGIQYFPTKIAVTESTVISGLPPQATAFSVTDPTSQLFDQISYLLATTSFKNMMEPNNTDADHYAYKEVFDGYPFPSAMGVNSATAPGPYDLMKGTSKVLFLNLMAMHYNSTEGTFVNTSSLDGSGQAVLGTKISAENASYIILFLTKFSQEFVGTPLQTMADNAINSQIDYILANFKDPNGGYYNEVTVGSGPTTTAKTLAANAAIIKGLYNGYEFTGNAILLIEANNSYNYLINNFYIPSEYVFKSEFGNQTVTYTPWNMAILSGLLRDASLIGGQPDASAIYTRVFKTVFNKMILCEAEASGESGSDSDGDGVPYIVGSNKPYVFAEKGTYQIVLGIEEQNNLISNLKIYPNPTTELVNVSINLSEDANVNVNIYAINGELISTISNTNLSQGNQIISIDLNKLTAGSYFIKTLVNNEPVSIEKLIIK